MIFTNLKQETLMPTHTHTYINNLWIFTVYLLHIVSQWSLCFFSLGSYAPRACSSLLMMAGWGIAFPFSYDWIVALDSFTRVPSFSYVRFLAYLACCKASEKSWLTWSMAVVSSFSTLATCLPSNSVLFKCSSNLIFQQR